MRIKGRQDPSLRKDKRLISTNEMSHHHECGLLHLISCSKLFDIINLLKTRPSVLSMSFSQNNRRPGIKIPCQNSYRGIFFVNAFTNVFNGVYKLIIISPK